MIDQLHCNLKNTIHKFSKPKKDDTWWMVMHMKPETLVDIQIKYKREINSVDFNFEGNVYLLHSRVTW